MKTVAPCAKNSCAMPNPTPWAAPVIRATFPAMLLLPVSSRAVT